MFVLIHQDKPYASEIYKFFLDLQFILVGYRFTLSSVQKALSIRSVGELEGFTIEYRQRHGNPYETTQGTWFNTGFLIDLLNRFFGVKNNICGPEGVAAISSKILMSQRLTLLIQTLVVLITKEGLCLEHEQALGETRALESLENFEGYILRIVVMYAALDASQRATAEEIKSKHQMVQTDSDMKELRQSIDKVQMNSNVTSFHTLQHIEQEQTDWTHPLPPIHGGRVLSLVQSTGNLTDETMEVPVQRHIGHSDAQQQRTAQDHVSMAVRMESNSFQSVTDELRQLELRQQQQEEELKKDTRAEMEELHALRVEVSTLHSELNSKNAELEELHGTSAGSFGG